MNMAISTHEYQEQVYDIVPVPKPRMTQSDKWKKRACTQRYWEFKDKCKKLGVSIPESGSHITFILPMPKSWSKKKRLDMFGKPHQQRPDKDNLEKALLDAILDEDCRVWDSRVTKLWGTDGCIKVGVMTKNITERNVNELVNG